MRANSASHLLALYIPLSNLLHSALCPPRLTFRDCLKRLPWLINSSFIWPMRSTRKSSEGQESKFEIFIPPASSLRYHHELAVSFTQGQSSVRQASPLADAGFQVYAFLFLLDLQPLPDVTSSRGLLFTVWFPYTHLQAVLKFSNLSVPFVSHLGSTDTMSQLWWIVGPVLRDSSIFQKNLVIKVYIYAIPTFL